jgi:D-alanyl-lipoteichoic acid acyltransferase DltB (MBOAT superfamily)
MLFNSYTFLFAFLPAAVLGFAWMNRWRRHAGTAWLLACSLLFYAWWEARFLLLLVPSIALNFALARALGRLPRGSRARFALLAAGVGANLAAIGVFKYADFVGRSASALLGSEWVALTLTLPLGISFFTFQQIAFLVDAHREKASGRNFTEYALFVAFFPQLIAGPIVHHSEMIPQFRALRRAGIEAENLAVGVTIFVFGLFKKVMLADRLSTFASPTFEAAEAGIFPFFADAWLSALAFSLQLYFDFSGYSDMAIGLGRMFGIKLPLNFDSPYKAASIVEFWRRWHMTLSRFLRDYLYIPLGGNRRGTAARYVNLMITMLLGGLWHGAGWTFVVWGGLHGAMLVVNHAWWALRERLGWPPGQGSPGRFVGMAVTFGCVTIAWVLFRAESFDGALRILGAMTGAQGFELSATYELAQALRLIVPLLLWVWFAPSTQELMADYAPALDYVGSSRGLAARWRPTPMSAAALALLAVLTVMNLASHSEFIYYQF